MSVARRALRLGWALLFATRVSGAEEPLEVTVTGERAQRSTRDATAASSVLRREELSAPGLTLAEALARAPGAQVTRQGGSADLQTLSLRGATSAQVPVYLAGIRLNDEVSGVADLSTVPLWMLDRVEVFRGSAPPADERFGIAGALHLEPRWPTRSEVGAGVGIGSFGERTAFVGGASAAPGAGALFAVRRDAATDDYTYTDDKQTRFNPADDVRVRRPNADHEAYDAWAIGRYALDDRRARVTVLMNAYDREQGVTGLGSAPALLARQHTGRWLSGLQSEVVCGGRADDPSCKLSFASSVLATNTMIRDPAFELGLQAPRVSTNAERLLQSARLEQRLGPGTRLTAAVDREFGRLRVERPDAGAGAHRRFVTRLSAALQQTSKGLELIASGAGSCHQTASASGCDVLAPEGRLGARYDVTPSLAVSANVARYARVATLGELFGTAPQVRGNPELAPETGVSADVGVHSLIADRAGARVFLDAFGFARSASDLIAFRYSDLGYVRPFNVASARVLGLELVGGASLFRHVATEVNVTLLDPRDTRANRQTESDLLPYTSRFVANALVELFAKPAFAPLRLERAALGVRARYRSSRAADPAGLIVLQAQTDLALELGLRFAEGRVVTRLSLDNALNQAQFDAIGFPLPGRSVHGSLEVWQF